MPKYPKIPTMPITISINGMITDAVFKGFCSKYLPAYEIEVTSGYRTPGKNAETPGSAKHSAHLYNLARDFVLKRDGKFLPAAQQEKVWEKFVKPYWPGYSYYNPPSSGVTGNIHVNLDRGITEKTNMAGYGAMGIGVMFGLNKLFKTIKGRKKNGRT